MTVDRLLACFLYVAAMSLPPAIYAGQYGAISDLAHLAFYGVDVEELRTTYGRPPR